MDNIGVWFMFFLGFCAAQYNVCPTGSARRVQNFFGESRSVQRGVWHRLPCPELRRNEEIKGVIWYKGGNIDDPSKKRLVSLYSGEVIPGRDRFGIRSDFSLVIQGVDDSDEGRYLCEVVAISTGNRIGEVDISVIGDSFPASTSDASSTASVQRGRRQTLPCECASQTPDVVYWSTGEGVTTDTQIIGTRFSDGPTLQIQHGADYNIDSDASLTVNSLNDVRDAQIFWCHVFQLDGSLRNCDTNVQISDAPKPTGALQASETLFYLQEGLRQVLPCTSWIPGTATCEMQWLKLDTPNQNVLSYNLSTNQIEAPATGYNLASDFGLVIASAEDVHAGRYRCDRVDTATESAEIEVRIIGNQFPLDGGSATAGDTVTFEPNRKLSFTCLAARNISLTTKATLFWSYGALNSPTTTVIGKLDLPDGSKKMSDLADNCFQIASEGSLNLNNCSQDGDVRYWCHVFPYGGVVITSYVDSLLKTPTGNPDSFNILPVVLCIGFFVIIFLVIAMPLICKRRKRSAKYKKVPKQEFITALDVKKLRGDIKPFIKKTFGQIPITPWVTGADADKAPMDKVYVPTEMFLNVTFQDGIVKYKLNSESEIFVDGNEELENMHVLINGRSGSGKSTLLHKVACDWSKGRKDALLAEKKLVFPVPATVLIQTGNLGQAVVEHMLPSQPNTLASSINEYCRSHPSDVALLVDGCKGKQNIDAVMRIMKEQGLLECQMIMTTRNAKIAQNASKQYNMRRVTINGFTLQNAQQYVNNILEISIGRTRGENSPKKSAPTEISSKHTDTVVTIENTPLSPLPKEIVGMTCNQKSLVSPSQRIDSAAKHTHGENPQSKGEPSTGSSDTVVNIESTPSSASPRDAKDKTGVHKEPLNDPTRDEEQQNKHEANKDTTTDKDINHTDEKQQTTLPKGTQDTTDMYDNKIPSKVNTILDEEVSPQQSRRQQDNTEQKETKAVIDNKPPTTKDSQGTQKALDSEISSGHHKRSDEQVALTYTDYEKPQGTDASTPDSIEQKVTTVNIEKTHATAVSTDTQQTTRGKNIDVFSNLRKCLDDDILPRQFVCLPANLATLCQLCVWTKGEAFRSGALTIGDVCYRLVKCMFKRSKPIRNYKSLNEETVYGYGAHLEDILIKEQLELLIELGKVIRPKISRYYEGPLTLSESDFLGTEGGQEVLEAAIQVGLLCRCKDLNRESTVGSTELNADTDVKVLKPINGCCLCFCCRQSVQSESEIPMIPQQVQIQSFVLEILEQLCVCMYLARSTESVSNWFEEMARNVGLGNSLDKISSVVTFACRENQKDRESVLELLVKIVTIGQSQSKSLKDVLPVQKCLELALEINHDSSLLGSANKTLNKLFDKGTIRLIGVSRHKIRLLVCLLKHAQEGGGDGKLNLKSIELFRIGRNDWKDVQEMFASFVQESADVGKNISYMGERQTKEELPRSPTPPHPLDIKTHSVSSTGDLKGEQGAQDSASIASDTTRLDAKQKIIMIEKNPGGLVSKEPGEEEKYPEDKQQLGISAPQISSIKSLKGKDPQKEQTRQGEGSKPERNLEAEESESQIFGGVKSPKKQKRSSLFNFGTKKNEKSKIVKHQSNATDDNKTKHKVASPQKDSSQSEQNAQTLMESEGRSEQPEELQTPEQNNYEASPLPSTPLVECEIPSLTKPKQDVDLPGNKGPIEDVASQKSNRQEVNPSHSSNSLDDPKQVVIVATESQGDGEGNKPRRNVQTDETEPKAQKAQVGGVKSSKKQRHSLTFSTKKNKRGEQVKSQSEAVQPDDNKTKHEAENLLKDFSQCQQNARIKIESESPSKQPKKQQTPEQKNEDIIQPDYKLDVHQPDNREPIDGVASQKSSGEKVHSSTTSHLPDVPLETLGKMYKPETLRALRHNVESRNEDMPMFPADQSDISVLQTVKFFGLQDITESQFGECHSSYVVTDFVRCLPELTMLESLILVGKILNPQDICFLASHLNKIPKLKKLDLRLNQLFDDRAFGAVTDSLNVCKELKDLRLSLYRVSQNGFNNVKTKMEKGGGKSWERLNTLYLLHGSPAETLVEFFSNSLKYLHDIECIHISASSPKYDISESILRDAKQNMENPEFVANLKMPVIENLETLKSTLAPLKLPKGKKKQTRDLVSKLEDVVGDIPSSEEIKGAGRGAVIGARMGRKVAGKKGSKVGTVVGAAAGSILG